MASEWIIGALAFITIGGVLGLGIFHFGFQLRSPENLDAAKRVAADRESASTRVSAEGVNGRSLRQRLDEAPGINDRLSSRWAGVSLVDAVFDTSWSDMQSTLKGDTKPSQLPAHKG